MIEDARKIDTPDRWDRAVWWDPVTPGAYPRRHDVRAIVLHWTGAEHDGIRVSHNLRHRRRADNGRPSPLSIHYTVDANGRSIRHADSEQTACMHAGSVNEWTVGIEIVNAGLADSPFVKLDRPEYTDTIHQRDFRMLRFTAAQVSAVYEICQLETTKHGIPWQVPTDKGGKLLRRQMSDDELASFSGIMGHFHCHPTKVDPGTHLLIDLVTRSSGRTDIT